MKVSIGAVRNLVRDLRPGIPKPIAIGGASELARVLERELSRGGDPSAVRVGDPAGAAVYVHVATGDDEHDLRAARRARVPIVAVVSGDATPPYVLATDVVRVAPVSTIIRAGTPFISTGTMIAIAFGSKRNSALPVPDRGAQEPSICQPLTSVVSCCVLRFSGSNAI